MAYSTLLSTYKEEETFISIDSDSKAYTLLMYRTVPNHLPPYMPTSGQGNTKLVGNFAQTLLKNKLR